MTSSLPLMKVLKSFNILYGKRFESFKGKKENELEDPTDACQRRLQPADVYLTFSFPFLFSSLFFVGSLSGVHTWQDDHLRSTLPT